jgi:hypothetical protein
MKISTCKFLGIALMGATFLTAATQGAQMLLSASAYSVSSTFSNTNTGWSAASNLFDGNPTVGSNLNLGDEWCSQGGNYTDLQDHNPIISMDMGSLYSFSAIGYSTRSAGVDNITRIDLWFLNSPFAITGINAVPSGTPNESLTVNPKDTNFTEYNFTSTHTSQYVVAQLFSNSVGGNAGAQELRMVVPEPATPAILLGGLGLLALRRRRA